MRRPVLAAALAIVPAVASAQPGSPGRTYAGCNTLLCTQVDLTYLGPFNGEGLLFYEYLLSAQVTPQPAAIAAGYSSLSAPVLLRSGPILSTVLALQPQHASFAGTRGEVLSFDLGRNRVYLPQRDAARLDQSITFRAELSGPGAGTLTTSVELLPTTIVPEPGAFVLLASGMAVGAGVLTRSRQPRR